MTDHRNKPEKAITIKKIETYILIIKVKRRFRTRIGAKGNREFDAGYYLYVGSGRENLVHRIRRHLRMEKKRFWHIDHMLASTQASIRDIYVTNLTEEEMVLRLEESGKTQPYDAYFGASDSTRKTHLFYCKNYNELCRVKGLMDTWQ